MTDKIYTVRFKQGAIDTQHLTGASAEVYGDQLVFLNSSGEVVALFQLEIVESWTMTNRSRYTQQGLSELVQRAGSASLFAATSKERLKAHKNELNQCLIRFREVSVWTP